jgi:predicted HicB family RNase H-like nuclease
MEQKGFALRVDKDIFEDLKEESKDKGISINKMINLKLKGLDIKKR